VAAKRRKNEVFMGNLLKFSGIFMACLIFFSGCNNQRERQIDWSAPTITIRNETELRQLASIVNNGQRHFRGQTIVLANDIDIDRGRNWDSIGYLGSSGFFQKYNPDMCFQGTFDGNGKTIRGNSGDWLFGCSMCREATESDWGVVKNLNTVGIQIASLYTNCFR